MFVGFRIRVVFVAPNSLALCVDMSHKYADVRWLTERAGDNLNDYRARRCLYHFGNGWYPVQFMNATGRTIKDDLFPTRDGGKANVFDYTLDSCRNRSLPWIQKLDPSSPAIIYKKPGSGDKRHGAAALCKLFYKTDDPAVRGLHREAILSPDTRLAEISRVLRVYFGDAALNGKRIAMSDNPLTDQRRSFPVPDLLFGGQKRLHVKRHVNDAGVELPDLGKARMRSMIRKEGDENGGTYDSCSFDTQHLLMPASLPAEIQDDIRRRLQVTMGGLHPKPYPLQEVIFDDDDKRSLASQVRAVRDALQRSSAAKGYAVVILPDNADPRLHNALKRAFWPNLQFQCANARGIKEFYRQEPVNGRANWEVKPDCKQRFDSYLRYLALGALIVNRKWPFMLAEPLRYDLYISIDVLNNTVGMTFLYPAECRCFFYHTTSKQREKLTRKQMREVVYEQLKLFLQDCKQPPRSIVFIRDGISFACERSGVEEALLKLQEDRRLPADLCAGTVEVHKQSAAPLRLFNRHNGQIENPKIGDPYILNEREGFVCTTGWPFTIRGTVNPLNFRIVDGALNIEWILEDVFAQAMLSWSAPDRCSRLPVIISLCDFFLRSVAGDVKDDPEEDEEDPREDDDNEEEDDERNELVVARI